MESETLTQPDILAPYATLENPEHAEERSQVSKLLARYVEPDAVKIATYARFIETLAWADGTSENLEEKQAALKDIANAIADAIPSDPKDRLRIRTQLTATKSFLDTLCTRNEEEGSDEKSISVEEIDHLYNPARGWIESALSYL